MTEQQRQALQRALDNAREILATLQEQASGYTFLTIPAHLKLDLKKQRAKVAEIEHDLAELDTRPARDIPISALWPLGMSYASATHFTGRAAERTLLNDWLRTGPPVLVLRALGGFGKSALAWEWLLHDVDRQDWPKAIWWSFYDKNSFEEFLTSALEDLGLESRQYSPRQQADLLLNKLARPGHILILDGFERALRAFSGLNAAYQGDEASQSEIRNSGSGINNQQSSPNSPQFNDRDCISPHAEAFLRGIACRPEMAGRVLITTRLRPRPLEGHDLLPLSGCREVEITALHPEDAATLFQALEVKGTHAEVLAACEPYGFHPLSLRLLAGLVLNDPRTPGDIAAAARLDVSGDLVQRQHHVLQAAYDRLPPERKQLLGWLACFRSGIQYQALQALVGGGGENTGEDSKSEDNASKGESETRPYNLARMDTDLRGLETAGLLHHDRRSGRYDLHPIVRRYAYDRLRGKTEAHLHLRDYFAAVETPSKVQRLEELEPLIELYHHTVRAGLHNEAMRLYRDRLWKAIYHQFSVYQLQIDLLQALFPDGEARPPRLDKLENQAWTLRSLANSYSLSGQPRRAVTLLQQHNAIREKTKDKKNLAIGLADLANRHVEMGALQVAEADLQRNIALCQEIGNVFWEAVGHRKLGRCLAYRGSWIQAKQELTQALELQKTSKQGQGITWAYWAMRALLMVRLQLFSSLLPEKDDDKSSISQRANWEGDKVDCDALTAARNALKLADEDTHDRYSHEHDYVRAHWLLGAAYCAHGQHIDAAHHLDEALARCRAINAVEIEANILIDLARLYLAKGEPDEAQRLAQEACQIAARCGYVLQEADAHLLLAHLAQQSGDIATARQEAEQARRLALCDGEPDGVYRVAYDEAEALLQGIGERG